jgi:hypothetical protein
MDTQQAFTKWRSSYGDLICPTTRDAFESGWNAKSDEIAQSHQGDLQSTQAELLSALKALTDWGREHTSPTDHNSPHSLLVNACRAIDKANARSEYWKAEHLAGNAIIDDLLGAAKDALAIIEANGLASGRNLAAAIANAETAAAPAKG